jgi:hypothetical protein
MGFDRKMTDRKMGEGYGGLTIFLSPMFLSSKRKRRNE